MIVKYQPIPHAGHGSAFFVLADFSFSGFTPSSLEQEAMVVTTTATAMAWSTAFEIFIWLTFKVEQLGCGN
jgi:hypothetical protein